jgi:hypothetical protein
VSSTADGLESFLLSDLEPICAAAGFQRHAMNAHDSATIAAPLLLFLIERLGLNRLEGDSRSIGAGLGSTPSPCGTQPEQLQVFAICFIRFR